MAALLLFCALFGFYLSVLLLGMFGTVWVCSWIDDTLRQRRLRSESAKRMREWEAYRLDASDVPF